MANDRVLLGYRMLIEDIVLGASPTYHSYRKWKHFVMFLYISNFLIVDVLGERSLCTVKYSTFASDEHCCIKAHGHSGHPLSIERSRSLRYRAGLGHTLQRTAVLRAVRCSITRSWVTFPFAVRQRAVCP